MGRRISYFKNNFNKGLKDIIFENFTSFRIWYLECAQSSMDEFNEPFGNEELIAYFKKETDLKSDFESLDKKLIDELSSEFVGSYYDVIYPENNILEFFGPNLSVWRYTESNKMVFDTKDQEFIRIWTFLTKGRSLKNNHEFDSISNDYKIGFLTQAEVTKLKESILNYFGDIEEIRSKYWTNQEKSNPSFLLQSVHNPKSSGLEYALIAISKLNDNNKELITGIE